MYAPYLTFYSLPEAVFHDTGNAINYSASPAYLLLLLFAFLLLVSSSPFFHPSCSRLTSPRLFGARVRKCRGGGELARGKTGGTVSINQTVLTMIDPVSASFHGSSGPSVDLIISNVRFWYWNRNALLFRVSHGGGEEGVGFLYPHCYNCIAWAIQILERINYYLCECVWRGKKMPWRQEMDTTLIQRCCGVCR